MKKFLHVRYQRDVRKEIRRSFCYWNTIIVIVFWIALHFIIAITNVTIIYGLKGAYSVRNFEKCIFTIILYSKVKQLENFVSKFQDDWSKIRRARAFWKKIVKVLFLLKTLNACIQKLYFWSRWTRFLKN